MTWVSTTYDTARTVFGRRYVRHNGHEYSVPAASSTDTLDGGGMVTVSGAVGAIRLKTSELLKPYPDTGDTITIKDVMSGKWDAFTCLDVSPQHNGETLVINYGESYAS